MKEVDNKMIRSRKSSLLRSPVSSKTLNVRQAHRLDRVNQVTASRIIIEKLLNNGGPIQVRENGYLNIDYNNQTHRKIAEQWIED